MEKQGEIILYQPDEAVRLEVRLEDETVWLTQAQIAELFQRDRTVITKHINNVGNYIQSYSLKPLKSYKFSN